MPGEAPPQMIEIEAVGAIASLLEKRSMILCSAASGQAPRSSASLTEAASACAVAVPGWASGWTWALACSADVEAVARLALAVVAELVWTVAVAATTEAVPTCASGAT